MLNKIHNIWSCLHPITYKCNKFLEVLVGAFHMEKEYGCHDVKIAPPLEGEVARMLCAYSDVSRMSPPVTAHLGNTA